LAVVQFNYVTTAGKLNKTGHVIIT